MLVTRESRVRPSQKLLEVALFIDVNNLYHGAQKKFGGRLDYKLFIEKIREHGHLGMAIAYGIGNDSESFQALLRHAGYECRWGEPKYNWNVGLSMDVVRQIDRGKSDLIVLGSGDPYLSHCAEYVRGEGIKCYCYGFQISDTMKDRVDRFYEIPEDFLIQEA
jgi:uncharacterized LabA/DUF88 family protein